MGRDITWIRDGDDYCKSLLTMDILRRKQSTSLYTLRMRNTTLQKHLAMTSRLRAGNEKIRSMTSEARPMVETIGMQ